MRGVKPNMKQDKAAISAVPKAPSWMAAEAKAEWKRVMPLLIERRIITDADLGSLENFCVASGQVRQMDKIIAAEGPVMMTKNGARAHPAVKIQSDAMTRARLLAAELGLTPVSRSRPSVRDDKAEDDFGGLDI